MSHTPASTSITTAPAPTTATQREGRGGGPRLGLSLNPQGRKLTLDARLRSNRREQYKNKGIFGKEGQSPQSLSLPSPGAATRRGQPPTFVIARLLSLDTPTLGRSGASDDLLIFI